jgi:hypothetical protein
MTETRRRRTRASAVVGWSGRRPGRYPARPLSHRRHTTTRAELRKGVFFPPHDTWKNMTCTVPENYRFWSSKEDTIDFQRCLRSEVHTLRDDFDTRDVGVQGEKGVQGDNGTPGPQGPPGHLHPPLPAKRGPTRGIQISETGTLAICTDTTPRVARTKSCKGFIWNGTPRTWHRSDTPTNAAPSELSPRLRAKKTRRSPSWTFFSSQT